MARWLASSIGPPGDIGQSLFRRVKAHTEQDDTWGQMGFLNNTLLFLKRLYLFERERERDRAQAEGAGDKGRERSRLPTEQEAQCGAQF